MAVTLFDCSEDSVTVGDIQRQRQDRIAVGRTQFGEGGDVARGSNDLVSPLESGLTPEVSKISGAINLVNLI